MYVFRNTTTGALIRTLTGHTAGVRSVAYLKDGTLASGADEKQILIW